MRHSQQTVSQSATQSVWHLSVSSNRPLLLFRYVPPVIWGRNGHLQTVAYGAFGRAKRFSLPFERHSVALSHSGTSTFDVFFGGNRHSMGDFTIAICPGIVRRHWFVHSYHSFIVFVCSVQANSSESAYVRTFVKCAGAAGFRCAVLNHLGALRSVKLTSNRIFTYGWPSVLFSTEEVCVTEAVNCCRWDRGVCQNVAEVGANISRDEIHLRRLQYGCQCGMQMSAREGGRQISR